MDDWDEYLPVECRSFKASLLPYVKTREVYLCPTNPIGWEHTGQLTDYWDAWTNGTPAKGAFPVSYAPNWVFQEGNTLAAYPLSVTDFPDPSSLIALGEARLGNNVGPGFTPLRNHAPLPDLAGKGQVHHHLKRTNYVFLDGHLQSLLAMQTLQPRLLWGPLHFFRFYANDPAVDHERPVLSLPSDSVLIQQMAPEYK